MEVNNQKWQTAKTWAKIAPHEYILEDWNPALFKEIAQKIKEEGVDEEFRLFNTRKTYRYWYFNGYKYWIIDKVLNREAVK